jgi:hypothetical protein
MELVRNRVRGFGEVPEFLVFYYTCCKHAETKVDSRHTYDCLR